MEAFFAFAYSLVALINVVSYFPQIVSLVKADARSVNVSIASWLMWAFSYVLSVGYGIFCLNDMKFVVVSGVSLVMVLSVTILLIHNIYYRFHHPEDRPRFIARTNPKAIYFQIITGVRPRSLYKRNRKDEI